MKPIDIQAASMALANAWQANTQMDELPKGCSPSTLEEAFAIQDAFLERLNQPVAGWKIARPANYPWLAGPVLKSRSFVSGAKIPAYVTPLCGIEAEIAFRFDRDMPKRDAEYTYDDVADAVTAFIGLEIVDSRFRNYKNVSALYKAADLVSSGGFVSGPTASSWRTLDLENIGVTLRINGEVKLECKGGHPAKDPLVPAVVLLNSKRVSTGFFAGQFIATGTYTGLNFAAPGDEVSATFDKIGKVELSFI